MARYSLYVFLVWSSLAHLSAGCSASRLHPAASALKMSEGDMGWGQNDLGHIYHKFYHHKLMLALDSTTESSWFVNCIKYCPFKQNLLLYLHHISIYQLLVMLLYFSCWIHIETTSYTLKHMARTILNAHLWEFGYAKLMPLPQGNFLFQDKILHMYVQDVKS